VKRQFYRRQDNGLSVLSIIMRLTRVRPKTRSQMRFIAIDAPVTKRWPQRVADFFKFGMF
jgi:hypothetical protein